MAMSEAGSEPLLVGRINGVYGIKGWVKIHSFTEPMENLLGYANWNLRRGGRLESVKIDSGRRHGKGLVAHIEGVDDRNAAELLKGSEIVVPLAELPVLEEGEYYWHQLQGLSVVCGDELLGRVDHLLETGANDVLVVKPCEGSRDQRERLIPWLPGSVVRNIDLETGIVDVDWDPEF